MKHKCDCHNFEHQVCNICQGVDPAKPGADRTVYSIVPTAVASLTVEEVKTAARELGRMEVGPEESGIEFIHRYQAAVEKIEDRGWKLGLSLSVHTTLRAKSPGTWLLKSPKKIFNVVYAFYDRGNIASKVIFHVSECKTKREALERIGSCPAPAYKQTLFKISVDV